MFHLKTNSSTTRLVQRTEVRPQWPWKKRVAISAAVVFFIVFSFFFAKVEKTFSLINNRFWKRTVHIDNYREKNRVDILMLGLRGKDDLENGGLLTDTMILLSINTADDKAAMISIPRDLYVRIPGLGKMEKVNFAYAYGKERDGDGLNASRQAVEKVTGVNIDYIVAVDFDSFINLIDTIGGIDVYVPREFTETSQWGWEFRVPKGLNHMNSQTALYYARSRYSTSDFDRSRRQQDILMAIADRALSLKILSNPVKLNAILNSLSKGLDTDIDFISMLNLIKYGGLAQNDKIIRFVLDDSQGNFLKSDHINGTYVLYPKAGTENYDAIKEKIRNIFQ